MMQVAFVHYHVKRGGVTRVMENAIQALSMNEDDIDGVVLCGHEIPEDCKLPARTIDGLGYSNETTMTEPSVLADKLEEGAITFFGSKPDVWHIHNHSLGKNKSIADAVVELAERGNKIVLQIHDFAEDGRPGNFRLRQNHLRAESCYPVSGHIHYVVLNRRDYQILKQAGIPEDQLHWLPNPVIVPERSYDEYETYEHSLDELIVYPVRAVRRKNMGEMLLHAALPSKRRSYVTTLGTTSKDFVDEYTNWKDFSDELGLQATFEVCQSLGFSFDSLIDQSHRILTTSVAEGYGLGFVEPWIYGKSLMGRDLPEITDDFRQIGLQFQRLYKCLEIPISLFRFDEFQLRLKTMAETYHLKYGMKPEDDWIHSWVNVSVNNYRIDFAKLDEIAQREVIESVQSNVSIQQELIDCIESTDEEPHVINENAAIVENELSVQKYGVRLLEIYEKLMTSEMGTTIEFANGDSVLDSFFSVERFLPLRT